MLREKTLFLYQRKQGICENQYKVGFENLRFKVNYEETCKYCLNILLFGRIFEQCFSGFISTTASKEYLWLKTRIVVCKRSCQLNHSPWLQRFSFVQCKDGKKICYDFVENLKESNLILSSIWFIAKRLMRPRQ